KYVSGSLGLTPNRMAEISRVKPRAKAIPATMPIEIRRVFATEMSCPESNAIPSRSSQTSTPLHAPLAAPLNHRASAYPLQRATSESNQRAACSIDESHLP